MCVSMVYVDLHVYIPKITVINIETRKEKRAIFFDFFSKRVFFL